MDYVVFSIDNSFNLHTMAKFLRYVDTKEAMGLTTSRMQRCIGRYKGVLEDSFIIGREDFFKFILPSGYIDNQESVMEVHVDSRSRSIARIVYLTSGTAEEWRRLEEVSKDEAFNSEGFTYRTSLKKFYVLK